ncbi:PAS domain S-box protein [Desulfococcaceae bacterium HSG7]|nr:PAS domain S-box protein [Desulfococcaceae bacterium HSG7]
MNTIQKNPARILIVDDESIFLDLYQAALCPEQYPAEMIAVKENDTCLEPIRLCSDEFEISLCNQGDQAIRVVQSAMEIRQPFAVAFIDVRMPPGPDGMQTALQIRQLDPFIQIVIATAFSDFHPQDFSQSILPKDRLLYVQKPFHLHEISQWASALSAKWRVERDLRSVNQGLEKRIRERTSELSKAYANLQRRENENWALIENMPSIVCRGYADGSMEFFDDRIETLTGYSREDFFSRRIKLFDLFIDEKEIESTQETLRQALKSGGYYKREYRIRSKNGNVLWIEGRGKVVFNEHGDIQFIIGTLTNITQQKLILRTLNESEQKYRSLFVNTPNPILIVNRATLKIMESNPATEKVYGLTYEELIDRHFADICDINNENVRSTLDEIGYKNSDCVELRKLRHHNRLESFYMNATACSMRYNDTDLLVFFMAIDTILKNEDFTN